jgi:signal transduction histidine kinase/ActR/RegA family two-component response regulator
MSNAQRRERQATQLEIQTAKVVDYFITSVMWALVPTILLVIYLANQRGWAGAEYVELGCFGVMILLVFKSRFLCPRSRAFLIATFLLIAVLAEIYRYGLASATFPVLTILPILASIIGGLRFGFGVIGVIVVALIGLAWFSITYELMPPLAFPNYLHSPTEWGRHIVIFTLATCVAVFLAGSLFHFHRAAGENLEGLDAELANTQARVIQSAKLAGLGYAVLDPKAGRILETDDVFAHMHGLSKEAFMEVDVRGEFLTKIIHEDDREKAIGTLGKLKHGSVITDEFRHVLPDGQVRAIRKIFSPKETDGPDTGVYEIVGQDVTETRDLYEKLFHTQKMQAIGTLTGGVAHDFNNLLAVILGNLELLDEGVTDKDQKQLIKIGIDATQRGAELTRNMLSFARQSQLEPTVVELNQLVRNMQNWIGRTLPSAIDVETSLLAGLWPIEVDPSSTESGLLNLILNARDAMPKGGKLTIETANVLIDDDYVELRDEEIEPGRYVLLAVSDTGEGISPENLKVIFEPFFTTKEVGAGSGLGLSMLEGFMRQSGGTVRVYSEPDVGTTFKLYFPASERSEIARHRPVAPVLDAPIASRETILLVEDNADVLEAYRATLVKSGYRVLEASTGDEAFNVFLENPAIDLLLTDIVMPGDLQGTTLARALRATKPDLKVIFMSGYAKEATVHGNGLRPNDIRLMKPVRREELMRAVSKALSKGDS